MKVSVLRIGHRLVRDDRVTTHAALVRGHLVQI